MNEGPYNDSFSVGKIFWLKIIFYLDTLFSSMLHLDEKIAESVMQMGLVGLLPLLPLTRDGKQYEVVEDMVTEIVEAKQFELLRYAQLFSSLVFKDKADREWLKRRFLERHCKLLLI